MVDTTEHSHLRDAERDDNVNKDTGQKTTCFMSVVVNFPTTESSQDNESSDLRLIWHVWESFIRDTTWASTGSTAVIPTGKAQQ